MSKAPFELFLALRYLRPKRTFVSVITLISVMGVLLGVAVLIIVISVMTGFDRQLRDKILGFNAHLRVIPRDGTMTNYVSVLQRVSALPDIKAVAPYVLGQVLMETQPESGNAMFNAPIMRGIEPQFETNVSSLTTNIVAGTSDLEEHTVLVGAEMGYQLRLRPGDRVSIYSPHTLKKMREHRGKEGEEAILPEEFEVRGIFDVGYYEYNANLIIMSLQDAQELYQLDSSVHGLLVMLHDAFKAKAAKKTILNALGPGFDVTLWTDENSSIFNALLVEKNVMFYVLFFIIIVAAFGIMNSFITFVVQKTREIGILKALGSSTQQVVWIFLGRSLTVGMIGIAAGLGLGVLAVQYRNEFLHFMRRSTGMELFPGSIYGFTELPAYLDPSDVLTICGSALAICLLAGLIPALMAGRLKPVEALRYE